MPTADPQSQIIDHLNRVYAHLSDAIRRSGVQTPDELSALDALVRARDEVRESTRRLLDDGFVTAGADLARANEELAKVTTQLTTTQARLETVRTVLDLASQAVRVAAQVAMAL